MTTDATLTRLEALAAAATDENYGARPERWYDNDDDVWRIGRDGWYVAECAGEPISAYIAAANPATVAALVAEVRALRGQLRAWQSLPHSDELFICPTCADGVYADEDGCCALCGADCTVEPWGTVFARAVLAPDADGAGEGGG